MFIDYRGNLSHIEGNFLFIFYSNYSRGISYIAMSYNPSSQALNTKHIHYLIENSNCWWDNLHTNHPLQVVYLMGMAHIHNCHQGLNYVHNEHIAFRWASSIDGWDKKHNPINSNIEVESKKYMIYHCHRVYQKDINIFLKASCIFH